MDIEPDRTVQDRLIQLEADTARLIESMNTLVDIIEGITKDVYTLQVNGLPNA